MDNFEYYMAAYMYELEDCLNTHSNDFKLINFQLDEANTDKEAKKLIKKIIKENLMEIENINLVKRNKKEVEIDNSKFKIVNVLTPEEYTNIERSIVKKMKQGIYVNPDLILKINFDGNDIIEFIEIKSTKNNNIPGSSIQQVAPNEWVIFIKHTDKNIIITTGQYKNSINGTMQFPDRSPRPQVSFSTLKTWNNIFRIYKDNILIYNEDVREDTKENILNDWQGFLAERWLKVLETKRKEIAEPWFNNNIRKFALMLITKFQQLNKEDQEKYLNFIKRNIKND